MSIGSKRNWTVFALAALVALLLPLVATPAPTQAQEGEQCFQETGLCVSGRILQYWQQNGGLPVFGLPITSQREETIGDWTGQVQWFERNRLELHPENEAPFDVLLGRLGAEFVERDGGPPPREEPHEGCTYFNETGYNVCGDFLAYWSSNGLNLDGQPGFTAAESLALFGFPLTGEFEATLEDGNTYTVQWFERVRFERHPQNEPPFNVLLSRLGASLVGEPVVSPAPAPAVNDRIVYTLRADDFSSTDIYTIDPDGSGRTQLTTSGDASQPVWSPDKSRIAFVRGVDIETSSIYIMNADGAGQISLTTSGMSSSPTWSPDGSQLAFERDGDIYVMNVDGSGVTNLTNHPSGDGFPDWSPDGSRIAFASDREATVERNPVGAVRAEIFIMNSDGSQPARVDTGTLNGLWPDWSPDSTRLAFATAANDISPVPMYIINPDGSGRTEVTDGREPSWSPDGTRLAFTLTGFSIAGEIYIVNTDGSGSTLVTEGSDPDW